MARTENTYRVEIHLNQRWNEDREVIEWLESSPSKSGAVRDVLIDYVSRSRVARQQQQIATLERDNQLLRKVIERLTSE